MSTADQMMTITTPCAGRSLRTPSNVKIIIGHVKVLPVHHIFWAFERRNLGLDEPERAQL